MISRLLYAFQNGVTYLRGHPNFILTLLLILVIPIAFVMSASQFLSVSKDNQERLERDRIGLLHDVFLSIITVSDQDPAILQQEIERIATLNPDMVAFRISEQIDDGYVPVAALNTEVIGTQEPETQIYNLAFSNPNESIVQNVEIDGDRYMRGVRLVALDDTNLFVLTLTSRAASDALFRQRELAAWLWMLLTLAVVMALVFRHVRLIDYGFLYTEAQQAIKTKDLFTNMIAHELRAPLTAMRGYASMIDESKEAGETEKKYAGRIMDSAERLLAIVNDLLDVARIQSGKLSVEKGIADLSEVVLSVIDELAATAAEKQIALTHAGTDASHEVVVDRKRMHQALTNLVSNALKYTKQGSIEVALEEKAGIVELRVKDTGMGISAEDQQKLFAPFFRVQSDDVSAITGTGLGMWITRQLIELMDAKIGVESIKGVGTHVVITIPKKPV